MAAADANPPTANELLRDALVRRQIYLQKYSAGLSADIIRVLDGTEAQLTDTLTRRLTTIANNNGADFGPETTARLKVLEAAVAKIRGAGFSQTAEMWDENLNEVAKSEADFVNSAVQDHAPVVLDTVVPTATSLAAIVDTQPFAGKVMSDWADSIAQTDQERIMDAIRIGITQGQTTDEIVARVVGTTTFDGADGVLQLTRNDATSITRTAVNFISNATRAAWSSENDDIISQEVFVATLDDRTTEECAALDGQIFDVGEGPIPPLHFNCRSTRVPAIDGKLIGNRPAVASVSADTEDMTRAEASAHIRALTGQVPAATTYSEFLGNQSVAFQNSVLGPTKAALFRDGGLPLTKFINRNNEPYTIEELRQKEPAAFKRAGV